MPERTFDGGGFGDRIVALVKTYVARLLDPLQQRLDALEQRAPRDGRDGKDGADGRDAPPASRDAIEAAIRAMPDMLDAAVARHLAAHPPLPGKDGRDGADGKDGQDGARGMDGRDGVGLAGALLDRDGALVVTLSNGETRSLGVIVGQNGRDGKDGLPGAAGRAGKDGADGRDGLGFDDLDLIEDQRGLVLRFTRGETVKEFQLPVVLDQGVWQPRTYGKGNGVTWGGSFWIAQRDTDAKPDSPDGGWRLAVKRGRDGRSEGARA